MSNIAIVNVNSFATRYPEHIAELEAKVGTVKRFRVAENIGGEELAHLIGDFEYLIMGTTPTLDRAFFECQRNVRLVTRHGIGYNHIDLAAAREYNIDVCIELGEIERDAVAEQAASLLAACSKRLLHADHMVRNQEWNIQRERLMGVQLTGKTTGVIGLGNIGSRFAEIMRWGYQNTILVYDPNVSPDHISALGYQAVSLETLLEKADFVSLHCNLNETNHHMINKQTLSLMKPTAILINTARGALIGEHDLYEALNTNKIACFGADVMTQEPIKADHPLLNLNQTVFSPHVGVYNETCIFQMDRKVMEDIYLMEQGQRPRMIVNHGVINE